MITNLAVDFLPRLDCGRRRISPCGDSRTHRHLHPAERGALPVRPLALIELCINLSGLHRVYRLRIAPPCFNPRNRLVNSATAPSGRDRDQFSTIPISV